MVISLTRSNLEVGPFLIDSFPLSYRSGAIKPMPEVMPFGLGAFICTVIPGKLMEFLTALLSPTNYLLSITPSGLLIGATISKNIANFLEENELFVPSDDDDDED